MLVVDRLQRGDTIIEVLFAVTVFCLVAIGGLSIMNSGTAAAQRSLEITLVRQQIDAQAEALRFVHQSYVSAYNKEITSYSGIAAEWLEVTDAARITTSASDFGDTSTGSCPNIPSTAFIMNARTAQVSSIQPRSTNDSGTRPYAQVVYADDEADIGALNDSTMTDAEGIWIEVVKGADPNKSINQSTFVDFHIRACWNNPSGSTPMNIGTIVRLYEPFAN